MRRKANLKPELSGLIPDALLEMAPRKMVDDTGNVVEDQGQKDKQAQDRQAQEKSPEHEEELEHKDESGPNEEEVVDEPGDREQAKEGEQIRDWGEVKKIIAERNELRSKWRQADQELASIREERRRIEDDKAREIRAKELENLEKNGQYRKALARVTEERDQQVRSLKERMFKKIVPTAISEAAMSIPNIDPTAIQDLHLLVGNSIRVDEDTLEPYVADADGKPLKDDMLEPVSVKAFVESFVRSRPRMLIDRQVKSSGLKPGPIKGSESRSLESAMSDPRKLKEWEQSDPEGYQRAIANRFFSNPVEAARKALKKVEEQGRGLG